MGAKFSVDEIPDEIICTIAQSLELMSLLAVCGSCRRIRRAILNCPLPFNAKIPLEKIISFHITDNKGVPRRMQNHWHGAVCPTPVPSPLVWVADDFASLFKGKIRIEVQIQGKPPFSVQEALGLESEFSIDQRALACEMQQYLGERWTFNFLPNTSDDLFYHSNGVASEQFQLCLKAVSKMVKKKDVSLDGIKPFIVSTFIPRQANYSRRFTVHGSKQLMEMSTKWCQNKINLFEYLNLVSEYFASRASFRLPFYDQLTCSIVKTDKVAPRFLALEMYDGFFFPHEMSFPICHSIDWKCVCQNINCKTLKIFWLGVTVESYLSLPSSGNHQMYGKMFDTYNYLQFGTFAKYLSTENVAEVEVIFPLRYSCREQKLAFFNELRCSSRPDAHKQWRECLLPAQIHTTTHWKNIWQRDFLDPLLEKGIAAKTVYMQ